MRVRKAHRRAEHWSISLFCHPECSRGTPDLPRRAILPPTLRAHNAESLLSSSIPGPRMREDEGEGPVRKWGELYSLPTSSTDMLFHQVWTVIIPTRSSYPQRQFSTVHTSVEILI